MPKFEVEVKGKKLILYAGSLADAVAWCVYTEGEYVDEDIVLRYKIRELKDWVDGSSR